MDNRRSMHELLCDTLRDVYHVEQAFAETIGRAVASLEQDNETAAHFTRMQQESHDQAARLKLAFHLVSHAANDPPPETTAWLKPALHSAMNGESAGYETLIAWARLLEQRQTAELLEQNMAYELQVAPLIADLTQMAANQNNRVRL